MLAPLYHLDSYIRRCTQIYLNSPFSPTQKKKKKRKSPSTKQHIDLVEGKGMVVGAIESGQYSSSAHKVIIISIRSSSSSRRSSFRSGGDLIQLSLFLCNIQIPIDLPSRAISLLQPLIRLLEMPAIKLYIYSD